MTPGTGREIGPRVTRASLTRGESPELALMAAWWFFGAEAVASDANPLVSGLAEVTAGWTGTVEVDVGGATATVFVQSRTSAAEVWDALVRAAARRCGGTWSWWPLADGTVVVTGPSAFTLWATGTTRDRLGLTSSYTGATSYTTEAHDGGLYTTGGLGTSGPTWSKTAEVSATGGTVIGASRRGGRGSVELFGTFAELYALAGGFAGTTWDIVLAGTRDARVRVESESLAPLGRPASVVSLELGVSAVRL